VSAEELRGQLGERLPGALAIAARSMGMTQAKFNDMLDSGKIVSDEFLPRFAQQLRAEFGGGVEAALDTANAKFAAFDNSIYNLQTSLGQNLLPTAIKVIEQFLIPAAEWFGRNAEIIPIVASAAVAGAVAMKGHGIAIAFAAAKGTFFTKVMTALNLTMSLNPIAIAVTALAAFTAAVVVAYKTSEKWRGYLTGVWETLKSVGSAVFKFLVSPFTTAANLITAALTFDLDALKAAVVESGKAASDAFSGMMPSNMARTAYEGFQRGNAMGRSSYRREQEAGKAARKSKAAGAVDAAFGGPAGQDPAASGDPKAPAADDQLSKGMRGITGGGSAPRNYNISIGKLVESINLHTQNVQQGADELADIVLRKLVQVMNTAQQIQ
jgi:hypothetical protein